MDKTSKCDTINMIFCEYCFYLSTKAKLRIFQLQAKSFYSMRRLRLPTQTQKNFIFVHMQICRPEKCRKDFEFLEQIKEPQIAIFSLWSVIKSFGH